MARRLLNPWLGAILLMLAAAAVCGSGETTPTVPPQDLALGIITLTSSAFEEGGSIPSRYTCDGENRSPPLEWSSVPGNTASLALIMDDPDAPGGIFNHWVVCDMDADRDSIPQGTTTEAQLQGGGTQGVNDLRSIGYGGPCPPPGPEHTYRIFIYAVDQRLDLEPGASADDVVEAMRGHVVSTGKLEATYSRQ